MNKKNPETKDKAEITMTKEAPKKRFSLLSIAALLVAAVLLLLIIYGVVLSMTNFKPFRGLSGSEWVGLKWYERMLETPSFMMSLMNSLKLRVVQILAGLLLSLPLVVWVTLSMKPGTALMKACLCLPLMCLPPVVTAQLVIQFLPHNFLLEPDMYFVPFVLGCGFQTAGFFAFCAGLFQYLGRQGIGKGVWQGLLVAFLISCLTLLTPDAQTSHLLSNSMNRNVSNTLGMTIYQVGLMNAQYSYSGAFSVLTAAAQCILGIVPLIVLLRITREDKTRIEIKDTKGGQLVFTTAQLLWLALLAGVLVISMGITTIQNRPEDSVQAMTQVVMQQSILMSLLNSLLVSVLSGLVCGLLGLAVVTHLRGARHSAGLFILMMTSCMTMILPAYLFVRQLSLINTLYALVPRQMIQPFFVGTLLVLALALRQAPERDAKGLLLGLMFVSAALAWGDFLGGNIYLNSQSNIPVSTLMYRLMMQGTSTAAEGVTDSELLVRQASLPVMTVLTGLPPVLFALGGTWFMKKAFQNAK